MLEYIILLIFIGLIFYPLKMDMTSKTIELILVCYAAYKSLLIGLFCAIIFVYHLTLTEQEIVPIKKVPLYDLEEKIRPKDSNETCISTKTVQPNYSPNEPFQGFNVEI
jgi:hypothetical protein